MLKLNNYLYDFTSHYEAILTVPQNAKGNGQDFVEALQENGYEIARGDKRGYVVLDEMGGVHSLTRAAGVKVAELNETLRDYPAQDLPSVDEAKALQFERLEAKQAEPELAADREAAIEGGKADAPILDRGDELDGAKDLGASLAAVADTAINVLGGLFDGMAGGGKPPPTQEEIKTNNIRNERIADARARIQELDFEIRQRKERELEKTKEQDLGLERELKR